MTSPAPTVLRAATRGSALARWQTDHVATLIAEVSGGRVVVEPVIVQTEGDRRQDVPLDQIGGRGVFVKEVQAAVLDGRADIAVHSGKDLPSSEDLQPDGLTIAAIPARGDARDVLVGSRLDDLAPGALVATGSTRRRAQLAWLRPDLTFTDLRGNIDTRLGRLAGSSDRDGGSPAAIVAAAAALERLGRYSSLEADGVPFEILEAAVMLPQVAQGALAIECRTTDGDTADLLRAIDDDVTRSCVEAERAFLATLGGGCELPVGAYAVAAAGDTVHLTGLLATPDGHRVARASRVAPVSERHDLGRMVADHLLDECGGRSFLAV